MIQGQVAWEPRVVGDSSERNIGRPLGDDTDVFEYIGDS